jgi:molybdenum cofactor cytidylyltransferase
MEALKGHIGAVVLAAGLSTRMGRPKMVLPWGSSTVIGAVVTALTQAGVPEIAVVVGGAREQVAAALLASTAHTVFNPAFENGEMLASLQTGLASLSVECASALVALGDQPQIQARIVKEVIRRYAEKGAIITVPSYQMRRGHPWLIQRRLWPEILAMRSPQTMRDFLNAHTAEIDYLVVDSGTILMDLDTPEDYQNQMPRPDTGA